MSSFQKRMIENEKTLGQDCWEPLKILPTLSAPSSETQRQIVSAKESLNGRKNMARRRVKNGEKSPWGQCLTSSSRRRSAF